MSEQDSNPPVSTGGGDDGTTTLLGSGRMGKDDPRIVALGDIDEASSFLGLARAEADEEVGGLLIELQRLLYRVMGDLAMPKEDDVAVWQLHSFNCFLLRRQTIERVGFFDENFYPA